MEASDSSSANPFPGRVCPKCKQTKNLSEFHKGNDGKVGSGRPCKRCRSEHNKKWRQDNYQVLRDKELRRHYGITLSDFEAILAAQGGRCAICMTDSPGGRTRTYPDPSARAEFHVDHDHATGKVRGLLCHHCNTGIGKFGDRSAMLIRAANYLERHGK